MMVFSGEAEMAEWLRAAHAAAQQRIVDWLVANGATVPAKYGIYGQDYGAVAAPVAAGGGSSGSASTTKPTTNPSCSAKTLRDKQAIQDQRSIKHNYGRGNHCIWCNGARTDHLTDTPTDLKCGNAPPDLVAGQRNRDLLYRAPWNR